MATRDRDAEFVETTEDALQALRREAHLLFPQMRVEGEDAAAHWRGLAALDPSEAAQALCLSGGGNRSATFCLGVLQGLARHGRLEDFHYLSTVSGGGYVGSWLSRWRAEGSWSQAQMAETMPPPAPGAIHPVRRLRSFTNYLTPNWGWSVDTLTVATIFLRNLLFNLLVWLPLVLIAAAVPRLIVALAELYWSGPAAMTWATFAVPAALGALWIAIAIGILAAPPLSERQRERWSRRSGMLLMAALIWLLLFGVMLYLPQFVLRWLPKDRTALGLAGAAIAALTAAFGYWSKHGIDIRRRVTDFASLTGARLLDLFAAVTLVLIAIAGALALNLLVELPPLPWSEAAQEAASPAKDARPTPTLSTTASTGASSATPPTGSRKADTSTRKPAGTDKSTAPSPWVTLLGLIGAAGALMVGASLLIGANRYSLHALYGNRLVRAYLGSARFVRQPSGHDDYDPDDDIPMSRLDSGARGPRVPSRRLFHVVNMTLNLARSAGHRRDWQERKAASFTATPLHCGSPVLGYAATEGYAGAEGMGLGRAMTISGAAASPSMGYIGSPLVALVMALFNVRLGWWLPNPAKQIARGEPTLGLLQMLREGFSRASADADWLYLSDGGHFDNLGLYEMVRRRCRRIVVIDASCDGQFAHADLHNAVRKIEVDFGVPIDLPSTLPGQKGASNKQRIVAGSIRYSALGDGYPDGELLCVKPILIGNEPPSLIHYAETSRRGGYTFPHHSTLDQFFDETQFESYRRLGEVTADAIVAALDAKRMPGAFPASPPDHSRRSPDNAPGSDEAAPNALPPATVSGWTEIVSGLREVRPVKLLFTSLGAAASLGAATTLGNRAVEGMLGPRTPPPSPISTPSPSPDATSIALPTPMSSPSPGATPAATPTSTPSPSPIATSTPAPPGITSGGTASLPPEVHIQINRIETMLDTLTIRIGALSPPGDARLNPADLAAILALRSSANDLLAKIQRNPLMTQQQMSDHITQLGLLERRIRNLAPNRNVRAQ